MFNLKKAYIIHGYTATPESHWFPWLAEELKKYDYDTEVVALPDSSEPELKKWRGKIESISPVLDSDTIFIGHSLGVITILDYLTKINNEDKLHGLFLVAGFKNRTAALPELDQFVDDAYFNKKNILAEHIISVAAKKDDRVDSSLSKELSEELNGKFIEVNHEGHFLGKEGYDTFELLRDEIIKTII